MSRQSQQQKQPESYEEDDEEDYDEEGNPYVPPCESDGKAVHYFGSSMPRHFFVPSRLSHKTSDLIETVNDWHFAMINDHDRNEFYQNALRRVITPQSVVLEIGAGDLPP